MMNKIIKDIMHPSHVIQVLINECLMVLPDKTFLRFKYRLEMGKKLNLKDPKTFSEKLQWLKLYNRKKEYTTMVDKDAVKKYVSEKIGEEYIIPTLGLWKKFEDIDFDKLPDQFVLKTTHDSGSVIVCKDKACLDLAGARKKIEKSLKRSYYRRFREWPYKDVPRRIIAEKYLKDSDSDDLRDYKFFCFMGEPRFCQVIGGRETKMVIDFFDMNWIHQPFHEPRNFSFADKMPEKPLNFEKMRELAGVLSNGIPFSRIDFYNISGKIYFGEITFFPTTGMGGFDPEEWDDRFGNMIILPKL